MKWPDHALSTSPMLLALLLSNSLLAQNGIDISRSDDRLSIRAANVSAAALADALTQELGINVVVTGDTESRVNLDIVDERVDIALGKLSPNHMLVRDSTAPDSTIIEVVLMMSEPAAGSAQTSQFLPSGSPADEVIVADPNTASEPAAGNNADQAAAIQRSSNAIKQDGGQAGQDVPRFPEPQQIDPQTGLPVQTQ